LISLDWVGAKMMNLFARILSHGFGLIIVALLVVGLIYRGKLFPEWELPDFLTLGSTPDEAAEVASGDIKRATEVDEPSEVPAEAEPREMPAPGEDVTATADETVADDDSAAVDQALVPEQPATESPESVTEMADMPADTDETVADAVPAPEESAMVAEPAIVEQEAGEPDTSVVQETPGEPAQAETTEPAEVPVPAEAAEPAEEPVPAEAAEPAEEPAQAAVAEQAEAAASAAAETSPYRVLAVAREAYWLRDYDRAEQMYKDLIAMEPDNPDGYGELGNMYFSQGNWEGASAAYYDAGVRLADQGFLSEARQLVDVIRGLKGTQADSLEQRIQSLEQ
jgi:hypothetical protein